MTIRSAKRVRTTSLRPRSRWRRGVVSVVSMMFLIIFGSLAAAMAIMSKGNLLTAAAHQHVVRALGAAEAGLAIAQNRLTEAASRFVIEKGTIDSAFAGRLWTGTFLPSDGQVTINPAVSYPPTGATIHGLADAVGEIHGRDANTVTVNGVNGVMYGPAPSGTNGSIYSLVNWLRTPCVCLNAVTAGRASGTGFQIDYAPLADGTDIRVMVTGYDFDASASKPVTRRITQDFSMIKRVNSAVLSPSKIMIGKNVLVQGDLGATYTDVSQAFGDPLIVKSDFFGMDPGLDAELTKLFNALATYDVNKDNRLQVGHPIEGPGIPDYSDLGYTGAACDVTGDGYVDEFDVFIMYYDHNHDGKVVLSAAATAGTPAQGLTPEFVGPGGLPIDDDLAILIDSSHPDRNRNGIYSYTDLNHNGRYDPGEPLDDRIEVDPSTVPASLQSYIVNLGGHTYIYADQALGFRDGVIDKRDQYAKISGKVVFRTTDSAWVAAQGNYMARLRGPIDPSPGQAPMTFGVGATSGSGVPDVTNASFTNSETALRADANGQSFDQQVSTNLGISVGQLASWTTANNSSDPTAPHYTPLSGDANHDGLPDNWQTAYFEKMPFNAPSYYDYYYRPVYENMIFHDVQIPQGNNGLFKNCQFIGVTYVRSSANNTHPNWSLYGKLKLDTTTQRPTLDPPRFTYSGTSFPTMLSSTDRPVLMATQPLDKADIPNDQVPYTLGYSTLPDPLLINGLRCIDTKAFSNNIRFHDCLFVGTCVSDTPTAYTHMRNKLQFTGSTQFQQVNPNAPTDPTMNPDPADMAEIAKTSLMLPNYSVDIGSFNSPPTQNVQLKGTIVAGVLDVRGNTDIDGALLLTFRPTLGQAPLADSQGNPIGNPAMFNATIGYFGPADGDDESLDPSTLPVVNGVKIVGWDLDGDGLPDLPPNQTPSPAQIAAGARTVPFYGYGRINLRFNPNMALPDGILLPLQIDAKRETYRETSK
jgi:hypothetical protein